MSVLAPATVGVMGSGRDEQPELAEPLGRLLARLGVNLLTGGGGGVMASVSRAYRAAQPARGLCIGILPSAGPGQPGRTRPGYPNPYIELSIRTHLWLSGEQGGEVGSRNSINILTPDAIVALPGGAGTAGEIALALAFGKPILLFSHGPHPQAAAAPAAPAATALAEVADFLHKHCEVS